MDFSLVPLANKTDLIDQCIDLINEEWPRSRGARMVGLLRLLNASPPMVYVLIENGSGKLIGHLRLSPLGMGNDRECWIESVVIRKAMRGQGIGRKLMQMVETEARKHGFYKICCSTTDKMDFYRRCGYKQSDRPIRNCGSNAPLLERFGLTPLLRNIELSDGTSNKQNDAANPTEHPTKGQSAPSKRVPTPPTPSLFLPKSHQSTEKTFMFKHLE